MSKDKEKDVLKEALATLDKRFGKGSVFLMDENHKIEIKRLKTGSFDLDRKMGGGWPVGRINEIAGENGTGKTTLVLETIAQAQAEGKRCAFIDVEAAYNREYAEKLGVNNSELIFSQPNGGEEAWDIVEVLAKTGEVDLIILDSIGGLIATKEVEGEMGDNNIGLVARMCAKAMRKIVPICNKTETTLLLINQLRIDIGKFMGDPNVTLGGKAIPFACSVRVRLYASPNIKSGDEVIGSSVKAKIIKNKTATPFKTATYDIHFGEGIDKIGELIDLATETGVLEKKGSWFSYDGTNIAQGKQSLREMLMDNPDLTDEIKDLVEKMLA